MQLLPGGSTIRTLFGIPESPTQILKGLKPDKPKPLPPPPSREDPAVAGARKKQRLEAKARSGRRSTVLTGSRGVESKLGTVSKPRASELLGG